jgi:hypothetical protein
MPEIRFSAAQSELVEQPLNLRTFLMSPAGAGKTTAAVTRLLNMLDAGVPGNSILVLVPQRNLGQPYLDALNRESTASGGMVSILTASGLAQRMVELFWPLVAGPAGFAKPDSLPTFLTLETAQYTMARLVSPLLEEGYFGSVVMDRNRLFSQIIDNLNKSAVVGFSYTEIGDRLKSAWVGKNMQLRVYEDAQACATLFRQHCLQHNLLDFSLQVETFWRVAWRQNLCKSIILNTYQHVIADNIEEDTPFAHNLLAEILPNLDSALLIYDEKAGYRRFLGADPDGAVLLRDLCGTQISYQSSFVTSSPIKALSAHLEHTLFRQPPPAPESDPRPALEFNTSRYYPQMLDWVAGQVSSLVHEQGLPPSEIVILAPFLSDALRFGLVQRLENLAVPVRSHRPSRSLREEPVTHVWLTLAKLAHPHWGLPLTKFDLAYALLQTIEGLDLVRGHLLAEIVYRLVQGAPFLVSFDQIIPATQERITFLAGARYERLRGWIESYQAQPPSELDHFISALFGEVLSQPGYRFHTSYDPGIVTARLIESVQKFRWVAAPALTEQGIPVGKEFIQMVENGVIAAQYLQTWQSQAEGAVLIAPAYTFLMSNYPVTVQFWLDIASRSWSERLAQPLTHPYVLSRQWPHDQAWSDKDEVETSQQALFTLATGLLSRCREKVYLGLSDLGEQGFEQRGPLLRIINRILQSYAT